MDRPFLMSAEPIDKTSGPCRPLMLAQQETRLEEPQMTETRKPRFWTRSMLRDQFLALGLMPGDIVMVHAAVSRVGPLLNGPDTLIAALREAVGAEGTVMAYTDWNINDGGKLLSDDGAVPPEWRAHVQPFDVLMSRATRDN